MRRWIVFGVLFLAAAGCGKKGQPQEEAKPGGGSPPADAAPISLIPVTDDSSLVDARLDSIRAIMLQGIDRAAPIIGRADTWAVDYAWLHVLERPGVLFTVGQMDSLERSGAIDTSTTVGFTWYRVSVHASGTPELLEEAARRRPARPPASLQRALERALQERQAGSS
jgi:hypothetical protein